MYTRLNAFIAIVTVALAATQGMGIPPNVKYIFESESTVPVKGLCDADDTTIRCDSGNGNSEWQNTQLCMQELGNTADCFCLDSFEYYAIADDNAQAFKACCEEKSGSSGVDTC